jgi:hypothetical protein
MNILKKWFGKMVRDSMYASEEESNAVIRKTNDMERMFGSVNPAVVAFRISNGYVVRTMDTHSELVGSRSGGFHYCKDHQEIAEHIIASEVKRKLNVGEEYQQDMFAAEKARAVAMQGGLAQAKRATNRI